MLKKTVISYSCIVHIIKQMYRSSGCDAKKLEDNKMNEATEKGKKIEIGLKGFECEKKNKNIFFFLEEMIIF